MSLCQRYRKRERDFDSALADSREAVHKESSRKSVRERALESQAFIKKNLKPQENVNIINCEQKIPGYSQKFLIKKSRHSLIKGKI